MNLNWEAVIAVVSVLALVVDLGLGVGLFWIGRKTNKIDSLEGTVTLKAEQLIDAKFLVLGTEVRGVTRELHALISGMQTRLERGDVKFDEQGLASHELELKAAHRESELKEWIHKNFGDKAEMAAMSERVSAVELHLARFEGRLLHVEQAEKKRDR